MSIQRQAKPTHIIEQRPWNIRQLEAECRELKPPLGDDPANLLLLARCKFYQKDYQTATALVEQLLARGNELPSDLRARIHLLAGHLYLAANEFDAAITEFNAAERADESLADACFGLALVHYSRQEWDKMEHALEIYTALETEKVRGVARKAQMLFASGRRATGWRNVLRAFRLAPLSPMTHVLLPVAVVHTLRKAGFTAAFVGLSVLAFFEPLGVWTLVGFVVVLGYPSILAWRYRYSEGFNVVSLMIWLATWLVLLRSRIPPP